MTISSGSTRSYSSKSTQKKSDKYRLGFYFWCWGTWILPIEYAHSECNPTSTPRNDNNVSCDIPFDSKLTFFEGLGECSMLLTLKTLPKPHLYFPITSSPVKLLKNSLAQLQNSQPRHTKRNNQSGNKKNLVSDAARLFDALSSVVQGVRTGEYNNTYSLGLLDIAYRICAFRMQPNFYPLGIVFAASAIKI